MVTSTAQKTAVGYLRVSDLKQTGERHSSLETQETHFREHCKLHNLAPIAVFTDVATGRRDDRKEYRCMVEQAKLGGVDFVVVQYLDRFGRKPREILQRYWELESYGVSVVATDEDIKEELILLVKAGMAGAESRRISERVRANMSNAISKGVHVGRPPYGLRPTKDINKGEVEVRWELDPEEAPVVREMQRLAVEENLGYKAIADRLTTNGYKAHGGRPFAAYTVQRILTNPAITGKLVYGRKPKKGNPQMELVEIPGFFPTILSGEEWQQLQERLDIRRENPRGKAHSSEYLLSGIARCGHCKGPMTGKIGYARKGKRYRNYYCSRAMSSKGLCSFYNGHSVPKLEKAILEYLSQFSNPEEVQKYLVAAERTEIDRREAELRDVEKRIVDSDSQFLQHLDLLERGLLNEQEFKRANEAAREKTKADEVKRAELMTWLNREHSIESRVEEVPGEIEAFLKAFQSMDVRQQKAHLQTVLKAAYVYRDGRIELEFRETQVDKEAKQD